MSNEQQPAPSENSPVGRGRKRSTLALGTLVVGLLAVTTWFLRPSPNGDWFTVAELELQQTATVTGELESAMSTDYGPPSLQDVWNFKIAFMAPEGSEVKEGDKVLAFDTAELRQRLQQISSDRDTALKTLEKRTTDRDIELRNLGLQIAESEAKLRKSQLKVEVPEDVVAANELRQSRIDLQLAQTEIKVLNGKREQRGQQFAAELRALERQAERAGSLVASIERSIEQMTIRAIEPGTIIYKTNRRREKKKVGDQTWRAETILQIPDLNRMRAGAEVPEVESGRLEIGQDVRFRLDAFPETVRRGTIDQIANTVEKKSWRDPRKVVRIGLTLSQTDPEKMRPGMRLEGTVEFERSTQLAIPIDAVALHDGTPYVQVQNGGRESWRKVLLGPRSGAWVPVLDGLEPGERVARF